MLVTIFTPTYNRAHTLERLYKSLLAQTSDSFCWLIVDDGSTDNTEELVKEWINKNKIWIRYVKQNNQGKSMAHNKGVELTQTELFVCVDSDDYLVDDAVEQVVNCWRRAKSDNVGILAFKRSENGPVTKIKRGGEERCTTLRNAYKCLGLKGDTMLVFRTKTIKKYFFPHFIGEKFVPEGYLYDQIDQEGTLILLEKALYVCEYLDEGYTSNMAKILKNNPQGYLAFINQRLKMDKKIKEKFLDSVRYVAMALVYNNKAIIKKSVYPVVTFFAYPVGILFYYRRYKNI